MKANGEPKPAPKKRGRWDQTDDTPVQKKLSGASATPTSWDNADVCLSQMYIIFTLFKSFYLNFLKFKIFLETSTSCIFVNIW